VFPAGDSWLLRVARDKVTTRRAHTFLGGPCPLAFYHLRQGAIVISALVVLPTHWINGGLRDSGRPEQRWHQVARTFNIRHRRHALIYIYIILQQDFKICQYKIILKNTTSTQERDMTTYPYLFGRILHRVQAWHVWHGLSTH
jgi:hypothetical protein